MRERVHTSLCTVALPYNSIVSPVQVGCQKFNDRIVRRCVERNGGAVGRDNELRIVVILVQDYDDYLRQATEGWPSAVRSTDCKCVMWHCFSAK